MLRDFRASGATAICAAAQHAGEQAVTAIADDRAIRGEIPDRALRPLHTSPSRVLSTHAAIADRSCGVRPVNSRWAPLPPAGTNWRCTHEEGEGT